MNETQKPNGNSLEPVSVVIPVYDECQSLPELYERLRPVLDTLPADSEILFVDDGSQDGTREQISSFHERDSRVRGLCLRRNFGKAIALTAGFKHAKGGIIVTMDGDLQDDPNDIPKLIESIASGADLACGWKHEGKGPPGKSLPSRFFNFITSRVTGVRLHDMNCPLKAYRREVIEEIDVYGDLYRFIPVMAHQRGFIIEEVRVQNHSRQYGQSKYGFERFLRGFFDLFTMLLLTRYAQKPLHFFGVIAIFLCSVGAVAIAGLMTYTALKYGDSETLRATPSRPLFFFGVLAIMVGSQVFSIGLIGELMTKFFHRSQRTPAIKHVIE